MRMRREGGEYEKRWRREKRVRRKTRWRRRKEEEEGDKKMRGKYKEDKLIIKEGE